MLEESDWKQRKKIHRKPLIDDSNLQIKMKKVEAKAKSDEAHWKWFCTFALVALTLTLHCTSGRPSPWKSDLGTGGGPYAFGENSTRFVLFHFPISRQSILFLYLWFISVVGINCLWWCHICEPNPARGVLTVQTARTAVKKCASINSWVSEWVSESVQRSSEQKHQKNLEFPHSQLPWRVRAQ